MCISAFTHGYQPRNTFICERIVHCFKRTASLLENLFSIHWRLSDRNCLLMFFEFTLPLSQTASVSVLFSSARPMELTMASRTAAKRLWPWQAMLQNLICHPIIPSWRWQTRRTAPTPSCCLIREIWSKPKVLFLIAKYEELIGSFR